MPTPRGGRPSLRPFRPAFFFGGFNGLTWMIGLGTPMVLLAERLGASTFQVGLASAFVFALLPVQVLATSALPRLGYRRQMLTAWTVRALFLLVPLALAWAAPDPPAAWMPDLLVASVFCFCLVRAFGVAAHIPWIAAIVPAEVRGRFFATDHAVVSIVGVGTLLFCAALFAHRPDWEAFALTYALALAGSAAAVVSLARLPDAPRPRTSPVRGLPRETLRLCREPGPFRFYLVLSLLATAVSAAFPPFSAYYLKAEAGLTSSRILALTAAQFAGSIVASFAIRPWLDRIPIRRFFQLGLLAAMLVYACWLALLRGADIAAWLPAVYAAYGVSFAVSNASHFTYLPSLGDEDERPLVVAVFTAVFGLLSGLAPMLWGLGLREAGGGRMNVEVFSLLFAVGIGLNAILVVLYQRLWSPRGHEPLRRPTARRSS